MTSTPFLSVSALNESAANSLQASVEESKGAALSAIAVADRQHRSITSASSHLPASVESPVKEKTVVGGLCEDVSTPSFNSLSSETSSPSLALTLFSEGASSLQKVEHTTRSVYPSPQRTFDCSSGPAKTSTSYLSENQAERQQPIKRQRRSIAESYSEYSCREPAPAHPLLLPSVTVPSTASARNGRLKTPPSRLSGCSTAVLNYSESRQLAPPLKPVLSASDDCISARPLAVSGASPPRLPVAAKTSPSEYCVSDSTAWGSVSGAQKPCNLSAVHLASSVSGSSAEFCYTGPVESTSPALVDRKRFRERYRSALFQRSEKPLGDAIYPCHPRKKYHSEEQCAANRFLMTNNEGFKGSEAATRSENGVAPKASRRIGNRQHSIQGIIMPTTSSNVVGDNHHLNGGSKNDTPLGAFTKSAKPTPSLFDSGGNAPRSTPAVAAAAASGSVVPFNDQRHPSNKHLIQVHHIQDIATGGQQREKHCVTGQDRKQHMQHHPDVFPKLKHQQHQGSDYLALTTPVLSPSAVVATTCGGNSRCAKDAAAVSPVEVSALKRGARRNIGRFKKDCSLTSVSGGEELELNLSCSPTSSLASVPSALHSSEGGLSIKPPETREGASIEEGDASTVAACPTVVFTPSGKEHSGEFAHKLEETLRGNAALPGNKVQVSSPVISSSSDSLLLASGLPSESFSEAPAHSAILQNVGAPACCPSTTSPAVTTSTAIKACLPQVSPVTSAFRALEDIITAAFSSSAPHVTSAETVAGNSAPAAHYVEEPAESPHKESPTTTTTTSAYLTSSTRERDLPDTDSLDLLPVVQEALQRALTCHGNEIKQNSNATFDTECDTQAKIFGHTDGCANHLRHISKDSNKPPCDTRTARDTHQQKESCTARSSLANNGSEKQRRNRTEQPCRINSVSAASQSSISPSVLGATTVAAAATSLSDDSLAHVLLASTVGDVDPGGDSTLGNAQKGRSSLSSSVTAGTVDAAAPTSNWGALSSASSNTSTTEQQQQQQHQQEECRISSLFADAFNAAHHVFGWGAAVRWSSRLASLESEDVGTQTVAIEELLEWLSYANEDSLTGFPLERVVSILIDILGDRKRSKKSRRSYHQQRVLLVINPSTLGNETMSPCLSSSFMAACSDRMTSSSISSKMAGATSSVTSSNSCMNVVSPEHERPERCQTNRDFAPPYGTPPVHDNVSRRARVSEDEDDWHFVSGEAGDGNTRGAVHKVCVDSDRQQIATESKNESDGLNAITNSDRPAVASVTSAHVIMDSQNGTFSSFSSASPELTVPLDVDGCDLTCVVPEDVARRKLTAANCLHLLLDVAPQLASVIAEESDALSILCWLLSELTYIDLAERVVAVFQALAIEIPEDILAVDGLKALLENLEFFGIHVQRSILKTVLCLLGYLKTEEDYVLRVQDHVHQIASLLTRDDEQLVQMACQCIRLLVDFLSTLGGSAPRSSRVSVQASPSESQERRPQSSIAVAALTDLAVSGGVVRNFIRILASEGLTTLPSSDVDDHEGHVEDPNMSLTKTQQRQKHQEVFLLSAGTYTFSDEMLHVFSSLAYFSKEAVKEMLDCGLVSLLMVLFDFQGLSSSTANELLSIRILELAVSLLPSVFFRLPVSGQHFSGMSSQVYTGLFEVDEKRVTFYSQQKEPFKDIAFLVSALLPRFLRLHGQPVVGDSVRLLLMFLLSTTTLMNIVPESYIPLKSIFENEGLAYCICSFLSTHLRDAPALYYSGGGLSQSMSTSLAALHTAYNLLLLNDVSARYSMLFKVHGFFDRLGPILAVTHKQLTGDICEDGNDTGDRTRFLIEPMPFPSMAVPQVLDGDHGQGDRPSESPGSQGPILVNVSLLLYWCSAAVSDILCSKADARLTPSGCQAQEGVDVASVGRVSTESTLSSLRQIEQCLSSCSAVEEPSTAVLEAIAQLRGLLLRTAPCHSPHAACSTETSGTNLDITSNCVKAEGSLLDNAAPNTHLLPVAPFEALKSGCLEALWKYLWGPIEGTQGVRTNLSATSLFTRRMLALILTLGDGPRTTTISDVDTLAHAWATTGILSRPFDVRALLALCRLCVRCLESLEEFPVTLFSEALTHPPATTISPCDKETSARRDVLNTAALDSRTCHLAGHFYPCEMVMGCQPMSACAISDEKPKISSKVPDSKSIKNRKKDVGLQKRSKCNNSALYQMIVGHSHGSVRILNFGSLSPSHLISTLKCLPDAGSSSGSLMSFFACPIQTESYRPQALLDNLSREVTLSARVECGATMRCNLYFAPTEDSGWTTPQPRHMDFALVCALDALTEELCDAPLNTESELSAVAHKVSESIRILDARFLHQVALAAQEPSRVLCETPASPSNSCSKEFFPSLCVTSSVIGRKEEQEKQQQQKEGEGDVTGDDCAPVDIQLILRLQLNMRMTAAMIQRSLAEKLERHMTVIREAQKEKSKLPVSTGPTAGSYSASPDGNCGRTVEQEQGDRRKKNALFCARREAQINHSNARNDQCIKTSKTCAGGLSSVSKQTGRSLLQSEKSENHFMHSILQPYSQEKLPEAQGNRHSASENGGFEGGLASQAAKEITIIIGGHVVPGHMPLAEALCRYSNTLFVSYRQPCRDFRPLLQRVATNIGQLDAVVHKVPEDARSHTADFSSTVCSPVKLKGLKHSQTSYERHPYTLLSHTDRGKPTNNYHHSRNAQSQDAPFCAHNMTSKPVVDGTMAWRGIWLAVGDYSNSGSPRFILCTRCEEMSRSYALLHTSTPVAQQQKLDMSDKLDNTTEPNRKEILALSPKSLQRESCLNAQEEKKVEERYSCDYYRYHPLWNSSHPVRLFLSTDSLVAEDLHHSYSTCEGLVRYYVALDDITPLSDNGAYNSNTRTSGSQQHLLTERRLRVFIPKSAVSDTAIPHSHRLKLKREQSLYSEVVWTLVDDALLSSDLQPTADKPSITETSPVVLRLPDGTEIVSLGHILGYLKLKHLCQISGCTSLKGIQLPSGASRSSCNAITSLDDLIFFIRSTIRVDFNPHHCSVLCNTMSTRFSHAALTTSLWSCHLGVQNCDSLSTFATKKLIEEQRAAIECLRGLNNTCALQDPVVGAGLMRTGHTRQPKMTFFRNSATSGSFTCSVTDPSSTYPHVHERSSMSSGLQTNDADFQARAQTRNVSNTRSVEDAVPSQRQDSGDSEIGNHNHFICDESLTNPQGDNDEDVTEALEKESVAAFEGNYLNQEEFFDDAHNHQEEDDEDVEGDNDDDDDEEEEEDADADADDDDDDDDDDEDNDDDDEDGEEENDNTDDDYDGKEEGEEFLEKALEDDDEPDGEIQLETHEDGFRATEHFRGNEADESDRSEGLAGLMYYLTKDNKMGKSAGKSQPTTKKKNAQRRCLDDRALRRSELGYNSQKRTNHRRPLSSSSEKDITAQYKEFLPVDTDSIANQLWEDILADQHPAMPPILKLLLLLNRMLQQAIHSNAVLRTTAKDMFLLDVCTGASQSCSTEFPPQTYVNTTVLTPLFFPNTTELEAALRSPQLAAKVSRQLADPIALASAHLPHWMVALFSTAPFLLPITLRRSLYVASSGSLRALANFKDRLRHTADAMGINPQTVTSHYRHLSHMQSRGGQAIKYFLQMARSPMTLDASIVDDPLMASVSTHLQHGIGGVFCPKSDENERHCRTTEVFKADASLVSMVTTICGWFNTSKRKQYERLRDLDQALAPQRTKIRLSRDHALTSATKVMDFFHINAGVTASPLSLEVEYYDEEGVGSGPTLEYYAEVIDRLIQQTEPTLFRDPVQQFDDTRSFLFPRAYALVPTAVAPDCLKRPSHSAQTTGRPLSGAALASSLLSQQNSAINCGETREVASSAWLRESTHMNETDTSASPFLSKLSEPTNIQSLTPDSLLIKCEDSVTPSIGSALTPKILSPFAALVEHLTACGPKPSYKATLEVSLFNSFKLLGQLYAKAVLDGRLVDLMIHPLLWEFVKTPVEQWPNLATECNLSRVDPVFYRELVKLRHLRDSGYDLETLSLPFVLPGSSPPILLVDQGDSVLVNGDNLEQYISHIVSWVCYRGVALQAWSFRFGIATLMPISHLFFFSPHELSTSVSGSVEAVDRDDFWTYEHLRRAITPDHGFTASSPTFQYFLETVQELSKTQRRQFLKFCTGTSVLPSGGFIALQPPMRVVKKEAPSSPTTASSAARSSTLNQRKPLTPDDVLPSVMACSNYIKLPAYSSKIILREKLLFALEEGQCAFSLS